jgi:hypothetical protein
MVLSGSGAHDRSGHPVLAREKLRLVHRECRRRPREAGIAPRSTRCPCTHPAGHRASVQHTPGPRSRLRAPDERVTVKFTEPSGAEEKEIRACRPPSATLGFAFSVVLEVFWLTCGSRSGIPHASRGINSQVRPRFCRGDICTDMLRSMVRFHLAPPAQAMFPQVNAGFGMTAHDGWSP